MTPARRMSERDQMIIKLRDEEGISFGEIAIRLKTLDPKWVRNDGTRLKPKTVEQAYKRGKARGQ